jgi:hypothetical protein
MKATKQGIFTALMVSSASAAVLVAAGALVLGSCSALWAQTGELQLVPSNAVPRLGSFHSMQRTNYPPLPYNRSPELDIYSETGAPGRYWYDDRGVDYAALEEQRQLESALRGMESEYGLNSPEGPSPTYLDGSLWLSISQFTNGVAPLIIHGTVPEALYEILSKPTLTNAAWASEGVVLGATNEVWTPAMVPVGDCTNSLFFRALCWADCDGFGTPPAWYVQHGLDPLSPDIGTQDADHDGLINRQEYLSGTDPQTAEGFTVWVSSPGGTSGIP